MEKTNSTGAKGKLVSERRASWMMLNNFLSINVVQPGKFLLDNGLGLC